MRIGIPNVSLPSTPSAHIQHHTLEWHSPKIQEPPQLLRRLLIQRPSLLPTILTDHPRTPTPEPRESNDDTLPPRSSNLEETTIVDYEFDQTTDIECPSPLSRDDRDQLFRRSSGRVGTGDGGREERDGGGEVGEESDDLGECFDFCVDDGIDGSIDRVDGGTS